MDRVYKHFTITSAWIVLPDDVEIPLSANTLDVVSSDHRYTWKPTRKKLARIAERMLLKRYRFTGFSLSFDAKIPPHLLDLPTNDPINS